MGSPTIQGWMRKKQMCFVSIRLSYQVLHFVSHSQIDIPLL